MHISHLPTDLGQKILGHVLTDPVEGGVDRQLARLHLVSRDFRAMTDGFKAEERQRFLVGSSRADTSFFASMTLGQIRQTAELAAAYRPPRVTHFPLISAAPLLQTGTPFLRLASDFCAMPSTPSSSTSLVIVPQKQSPLAQGWAVSCDGAGSAIDFAPLGFRKRTFDLVDPQETTYQMGCGFILETHVEACNLEKGASLRIFNLATKRWERSHSEEFGRAVEVVPGSDGHDILLYIREGGHRRGQEVAKVAIWGIGREYTVLPGLTTTPTRDGEFFVGWDAATRRLIGARCLPARAVETDNIGVRDTYDIGKVNLYIAELGALEEEPRACWSRLSAQAPSGQHYYRTAAQGITWFGVSAGRAASVVIELDGVSSDYTRAMILAWDTSSGRLLYEQTIGDAAGMDCDLSLNGSLLAVVYRVGAEKETRLRLTNLDHQPSRGPLWEMIVAEASGGGPVRSWEKFARPFSSPGAIWLSDNSRNLIRFDAGEDREKGENLRDAITSEGLSASLRDFCGSCLIA